jgi:hypothetical protein
LFSEFACFIVHGRNCRRDGWTTAVHAKDFRENREEIDPSKSNPSRFGWLGLGNHIEANAELVKITAELRAYPDVLGVRLAIYAQARKWDMCVDIAGTTIKPAPDSSVYRILPKSRIRFTGLVVFGGHLVPQAAFCDCGVVKPLEPPVCR